jgi:hypothetical protein
MFNEFKKIDSDQLFSTDELLVLSDTNISKDLQTLLNIRTELNKYIESEEDPTIAFEGVLKLPDIQNLVTGFSHPAIDKIVRAALNPSQTDVNTLRDSDILKLEPLQQMLRNLQTYQTQKNNELHQMLLAHAVLNNSAEFVTNSIYDFVKDFDIALNDLTKARIKKLMDVLKDEEFSLFKVADISNYLSDGINVEDIKQAVNVIEILQTIVLSMSVTTVDYDDPVGFVITRQKFAEKNKTGSDVTKLKTITSDSAKLITQDLDRLITKLNFLRQLLLSNSGQLFKEQELIREKTTKLLLEA